MDNKKTVNITNLIKTLKKPELKKIEYKIEDEVLEILVTPTIPFTERVKLINDSADFVFAKGVEGKDVVDYQPYYKEFAFKYSVVKAYTNIEFPQDVDSIWLLLTETTLYDDVKNIITDDLCVMKDELEELIRVKTEYLINHKNFSVLKEKIMPVIEEMLQNFENIDFEKIAEQIPELDNLQSKEFVGALTKAKKKVKKK